MKALDKVFIRVFVTEFYRVNAGFFLIVAGLCFGFLSGREHKALAQAFVSSPLLLLIPFAVWIIYGFKVIGFNSILLTKTENSFLFQSSALPRFQLWKCISMVSFMQLLPVLSYGMFLMLVALPSKQFNSFALSTTILLSGLLLITWKTVNLILSPKLDSRVSLFKNKIDVWITKPFVWFYPEWIIRQQPLLIIGTKLFSCLIIIGTSRLYLFDTYDERLMAMGSALAFASNLVVVFYYHRFENFHYPVLRSLPFSLPKRLSLFILTFIILNAFEWGTLYHYFPVALGRIHFFLLITFSLSIYVIGYACLFIKDVTLELFIQKTGIAAFTWFILILFKVPLLVFITAHLIAGYWIYHNRFYKFEFNSEVGSDK